jgi:UDP-glucose 4-epimerase
VSKRVLVTGGGGFIGSNLARRLLEQGDAVRVLDNFSTGNRRNLADVVEEIEVVEGELRSYERVHNAMRGVEVVFHQGALPSVPRSVQDPLTTGAVNVEGTLNVLLAARDEGVRRVIIASSSSVYGNTGTLPRFETQFPDPLSQYAAVVPRFIAAVDACEPVSIYGDGEQSRDFTYVDNVVDANLLAADAPEASGHVMNVATGEPRSVNALADAIGEVLGKPVEKEYLPPRTGDVRDSWADVAEARRLLGWEPQVGLEDGLRLTADAFLARA